MGQVILGSAVSLYFTPTVVAELAAHLPAIAAATVSVFWWAGGLGALTLSRASGVDGKRTFFASIPAVPWRWPCWQSAMAPRSLQLQ